MRKVSRIHLPSLLVPVAAITVSFFVLGLLPTKSYPSATTPANAVYTSGTNFYAGSGILPIANGGTGSTSGFAVLNSYNSTTISAAGTTTLTATSNVNAQNVTISAGSGTYTASIVLSDTASTGAFYDIYFSIPASSNPTINVYDGSTGGTLLNTLATNGIAGNTTISYFFNGTAWVRFGKGAALTYQNLSDLTSPATARTNLGLGSGALISSTAGGDLSGTLPSPTVTKINGTSLAGLSTGILKNTTSTGVPSIASANDIAAGLTGTTGTLNLTSGTVTVATATAGDSSNKPASTSFVATSFAPLASPALTGSPTAPTQSAGDTSNKIATDNFVSSSFAPLVSPTFLGTPSLPTGTTAITQTSSDNSSKVATTQFVQSLLGGSTSATPDFKNRIINGDMRISQRNGTSSANLSNANTYFLDRWYASASGTGTPGTIIQSTNPGQNFQYAMQLTGAASNTGVVIGQKIEATHIYDLSGSTTCTVSCYLASSSLTSLTMTVYGATAGTDNWSSRSAIAVKSWTISASLTQYTYTFTFSSNLSGVSVEFTGGALASGATLTITGVQLESGSAATSFERTPISQELAQCQRYYSQFGGPANSFVITGYQTAAYNCGTVFYFPVTMRAVPAIAIVGTISTSNCATFSTYGTSTSSASVGYACSTTGQWGWQNTANSYITFSAEL